MQVDSFFDEKKPKPSFDVVQSSLPYVFNCLVSDTSSLRPQTIVA